MRETGVERATGAVGGGVPPTGMQQEAAALACGARPAGWSRRKVLR